MANNSKHWLYACALCNSGWTNPQIAERLTTNTKSVEKIFTKLKKEGLYSSTETRSRIIAIKETEVLAHYDKNIDSGKSYKDLAGEFKMSVANYREICVANGRSKPLTKLQVEVKELRLQGLCSVEIANRLNKDSKQIRAIARRIDLPFTKEEIEKSMRLAGGSNKHDDKWASEFVKSRTLGAFEYAGGYIGIDSPVNVRCAKCGSVTSRSMTTIRSKNIRCDICYQQEKSEKRKQAEVDKTLGRIQYGSKSSLHQLFVSKCKECGGPIVDESKHKYCSEACKKRSINRKKDNRINESNIVNKDITLQKLFFKDNAKCYICGCTCDWSDCTSINGVFLVGNTYPTIEHVRPLSKGGMHSWDNVKLACFRCNTVKGAKYAV